MMSYRSLFLSCALSLFVGACPEPNPPPFVIPASDDLSAAIDLTQPADLTSTDLAMPDLLPMCGYRQAFVLADSACACNAASGHTVACSKTFCCSTGQTCLDGNRCSSPTGRRLAAMAYDEKRGRTVLFGGDTYDNTSMSVKRLDDLWVQDAVTWGPLFPSGAKPTARVAPAMAYDGARMVLFGGGVLNPMNMATPSGETWVLDGSDWTQVVGSAPPARSGHTMAYDSARGRGVLFGGEGAPALLNDTWEWNGTAWLQKTLVTAPTPRENHGMAYDAKRGVTVLFGGTTGVFVYSNETWTYNGSAWTRVTTLAAETPTQRSLFAMAYDANRERVVIFTGETPGATALTDTWEWDGAKWTKLNPAVSPPPRLGPAMVYDPGRKVLLLYGGLVSGIGWANDVWSFDGTTWTRLY